MPVMVQARFLIFVVILKEHVLIKKKSFWSKTKWTDSQVVKYSYSDSQVYAYEKNITEET